jgi:hypothetical protein
MRYGVSAFSSSVYVVSDSATVRRVHACASVCLDLVVMRLAGSGRLMRMPTSHTQQRHLLRVFLAIAPHRNLYPTPIHHTMPKAPGPILRAWYEWRMKRFPWRKKWLVGSWMPLILLSSASLLECSNTPQASISRATHFGNSRTNCMHYAIAG